MKEFNDTVKPCTKLCGMLFIYITHTHTYIYIYLTYITLHIYITFFTYISHLCIDITYIHINSFLMEFVKKQNLKEFQNSCLWGHKAIAVIQWLYLYVKLCCMHIATKKVFKEPF